MLVFCIYLNDVHSYRYKKVYTKVYNNFFQSSQQRATIIGMHLVPASCALELSINFLAVTATTLLLQRPRC